MADYERQGAPRGDVAPLAYILRPRRGLDPLDQQRRTYHQTSRPLATRGRSRRGQDRHCHISAGDMDRAARPLQHLDKWVKNRPFAPPRYISPDVVASITTAATSKIYRLCTFGRGRCRNRTPGPPLFPSMNSTPAASKARRTAKSLAMVIDVSPSASSARLIVASPNAASRASSAALHRRRARAARIWALFNGFGFIVDQGGIV
jgi:hypothetical protein